MIEALHTPKFQPINTIVGLWTCPTCVESIAMAGVNVILQSSEALEALGRGLTPALALLVQYTPPPQSSFSPIVDLFTF